MGDPKLTNQIPASSPTVCFASRIHLISWRLRRLRTLTSPISVMPTVHQKHGASARWVALTDTDSWQDKYFSDPEIKGEIAFFTGAPIRASVAAPEPALPRKRNINGNHSSSRTILRFVLRKVSRTTGTRFPSRFA
jgi:hypothetical protein